MSWEKATGFSDGAARGNPGPSGAGGVLIAETGEHVELGRYLGETTNNVAEYTAFLMVLQAASKLGVREIIMCTDSELLVKQVKGIYRVKAEHLMPLHREVSDTLKTFAKAIVRHVPREANKEADRMSNRAIDEKLSD